MKIIEAHKLAIKLRDQHGLSDWTVRFEEWNEYAGVIATCYEFEKILEFSPMYFIMNKKQFCKDQILHEIAHALTDYDLDDDGSFDGHGKLWKAKCNEIGAIPHELWEGYHSYNTPTGKVKAHKKMQEVNCHEKIL